MKKIPMDHKERRRHYRRLRQQVKTVEDMSLKRAMQDWNMKYVDIARSPWSTIRVCTSTERLANQLKINEITEVGELVTKFETNAPKIGKSELEKLKNW